MPYPDNQRTVKVRIRAEELGQLLGIPAGAHIVAVQSRIDPPSIDVLVWSADFPLKEYDPDSESPYAYSEVVVTSQDDAPIHVERIWHWPTTAESGGA